jgi:hypothetical protein
MMRSDEIAEVGLSLSGKYEGGTQEFWEQAGFDFEQVMEGFQLMGWDSQMSLGVLLLAAAAVGFQLCVETASKDADEHYSVTAVASDGRRFRKDVTFRSFEQAELEAEMAASGDTDGEWSHMEIVRRVWRTEKVIKIEEAEDGG